MSTNSSEWKRLDDQIGISTYLLIKKKITYMHSSIYILGETFNVPFANDDVVWAVSLGFCVGRENLEAILVLRTM